MRSPVTPCVPLSISLLYSELVGMSCSVLQLQRKQLNHDCSVYCSPSEAYKMTYLPVVEQLMPLPDATGFCSRGRSQVYAASLSINGFVPSLASASAWAYHLVFP